MEEIELGFTSANRQPGVVFVDLSHPIHDGMITYPGLPAPVLTDLLTRDQSAERFGPAVRMHIGSVCMAANTGTYIDVPFHFHEHGDDLAAVTIDRVASLPGVVVSATAQRAVGPEAFADVDVRGRAVLIRTGWDRHFGTDAYGVDAPFLSAPAVDHLLAHDVALVGIDSVNIDDMGDLSRPAHTHLLGAGVPIVEHLTNLAALGDRRFRFTAAPPKFTALGTFPVRAYAEVDDGVD
jgi:arylformamidase